MIVADTNLLAYLLIPGPFSAAAEQTLKRDPVWIAPPVWRHELLNVLATSVRAGHLAHDKALEVWVHAPAFVKDAEVSPLKVLDLAVESKFATFDCYYVALARSLAARLVTADKRMIAQFSDVTVSIEEFAAGGVQ